MKTLIIHGRRDLSFPKGKARTFAEWLCLVENAIKYEFKWFATKTYSPFITIQCWFKVLYKEIINLYQDKQIIYNKPFDSCNQGIPLAWSKINSPHRANWHSPRKLIHG